MRRQYDFSDSVKNPYTKKLKTPVTIRLENDIIAYFKALSVDSDIPYQKLINLFLRECAMQRKKPTVSWGHAKPGAHGRPALHTEHRLQIHQKTSLKSKKGGF
jgi:hypothetical protein